MNQTIRFEGFEQGPPAAMGICFVIAWLVFALAMLALTAIVYCKIFGKAGYPWAMGLLMLVPIANLIVLLMLAFGDWPILKEMQALKAANRPPTAPTDAPSSPPGDFR